MLSSYKVMCIYLCDGVIRQSCRPYTCLCSTHPTSSHPINSLTIDTTHFRTSKSKLWNISWTHGTHWNITHFMTALLSQSRYGKYFCISDPSEANTINTNYRICWRSYASRHGSICLNQSRWWCRGCHFIYHSAFYFELTTMLKKLSATLIFWTAAIT